MMISCYQILIMNIIPSNFFQPACLLHLKEQLTSSMFIGIVKCTHNLEFTLKYLLFNRLYLFLKNQLSLHAAVKFLDLCPSALYFLSDCFNRVILFILYLSSIFIVFLCQLVFILQLFSHLFVLFFKFFDPLGSIQLLSGYVSDTTGP